MSNPSNTLSQYRTYAYHHFLLLCSSSSVAENIGKSNTDLSQLQHPPGNRYGVRAGQGGSYVTLIDGMSDAHLNITKVSWKTIISPSRKTKDGAHLGHGPSINGLLDIYEPNGASFLEVISKASNAMNVSPTVAIYAVKTIFVGHPIDTSKPPVYINSIRPFTAIAHDVSAIYDSTGSKYKLLLFGTVGGSRKAPQQVFSGNSISIEQGQTLTEVAAQITKLAN